MLLSHSLFYTIKEYSEKEDKRALEIYFRELRIRGINTDSS